MKIKLASREDAVKAGRLYDDTVAFLDAHINFPKWRYKIYPTVETALGAQQNGELYVIEDEGTVTGAFILNFDPSGNYQNVPWKRDLKEGEYMVIHTLAVAPGYQGKGIGGMAVSFCIDEALRRGCKAIRLDIVPSNEPAAKLYEKHGFTLAGTADLGRGIEDIPEFTLYELNLK